MTSQDGSLHRLKISAHTRLARLYGADRAEAITDQLMGLVQRYQPVIYHHTRDPGLDETDTLLIT